MQMETGRPFNQPPYVTSYAVRELTAMTKMILTNAAWTWLEYMACGSSLKQIEDVKPLDSI